MAREFIIQENFSPAWPGGPGADCLHCGVDGKDKGYVVRSHAPIEFKYKRGDTEYVGEKTLQLCGRCIDNLMVQLGGLPAPAAIKLKSQVMKAEADRAKAERRAEAAEKAIHSMQDWIANTEADGPVK